MAQPRRLAAAVAVLVSAVAPGRAAMAQPASPAAITVSVACAQAVDAFSVAVQGVNFNPFTAVLVTFDAAAGGPPESFDATTDGFGRFATTIRPQPRPAGTYQVRADDFREREATAAAAVSCPGPPPVTPPPVVPPVFTPTLAFHPAVTRRGFVVALSGAGFPPSSVVQLDWGVLRGRFIAGSVATDASGNLSVPRVLVFEETPLGTDGVVATPGGPASFGAVTAPLLVVPGTLQPPGFEVRR